MLRRLTSWLFAILLPMGASSLWAQNVGAMTNLNQTISGTWNFTANNTHTGNETFANITVSGTCGGCGSAAFTPQTNGSNNSTTTGLNFLSSSVDAVGLHITASNPSGTQEKFEITGTYSGTVGFLTGCSSGLTAGAICYWNGS